MKSTKILIAVSVSMVLFLSKGFSDTGAFFSSGDTIFSISETSIELIKEDLSFDLQREKGADVVVSFEFLNPGPDKKLTLGFVTPPGNGYKVPSDKPNIDGFTVELNGESLEYQITQYTEKTEKDLARFAKPGDFVYLFDANLKRGINKLVHTYTFHGYKDGANCYQEIAYPYRLSTGLSWAKRKIGDFRLTIKASDEMLITVPGALDKGKLQWQASGLCKTAPGFPDEFGSRERIFALTDVYLHGGTLSFSRKDFIPQRDLIIDYFPYPQDLLFYSYRTSKAITPKTSPGLWDLVFANMPWCGEGARDRNTLQKLNLSKNDFRIMRNAFFARAGYTFKDFSLKTYFNNFLWYSEDQTYVGAGSALEPEIRRFIELLQTMENEK